MLFPSHFLPLPSFAFVHSEKRREKRLGLRKFLNFVLHAGIKELYNSTLVSIPLSKKKKTPTSKPRKRINTKTTAALSTKRGCVISGIRANPAFSTGSITYVGQSPAPQMETDRFSSTIGISPREREGAGEGRGERTMRWKNNGVAPRYDAVRSYKNPVDLPSRRHYPARSRGTPDRWSRWWSSSGSL